MKRKIVLWGTNEKEEKILVALHLQDKEGKVNLYTFNEEQATEDFYNKMLNQWRENVEVEFPEGHVVMERPLNMTDSILPIEIKVDRTDIVARAQTEWHFVVLSAKLYEMYRTELEDLTDTIENLKEYDNKIWNEMRNFWSKVQEQVIEKNLFRDHASTLKSKTNKMFDKLKSLKKEVENKYEGESAKYKASVMGELQEIETKIEKGLGLKPIFEELKNLQGKLRGMKFTKKDRDQVWNKLDGAFKVVKEKRFGDKGDEGNAGNNSAVGRHQRRYDGLVNAIQKMEKSIFRDKDDQKFQDKKIATTHGQLEMQIRQAKIKMIDERVKSKELKLEDMYKTRIELEGRIAKEKQKEEKRAKMQEAKATAEAKIAAEVKKSAENVEASADKLEEAAAKIAAGKIKIPAAIPAVELPSEDIVNTITETKEEVKEETKEAPKAEETKAESPKEETSKAEEPKVEEPKTEEAKAEGPTVEETTTEEPKAEKESKEEPKEDNFLGAIAATMGEALGGVSDAIEDVVDTVKAVAEVVEDKIEDAVEDFKDQMNGEEE